MKHKNYDCGKEKNFKCTNCNAGYAYKFKRCKKCKKVNDEDQAIKISEIPKPKVQSQEGEHSESAKLGKPNETKAKSDTKEVPANIPLKKRKVTAVFDDDKAREII